VKVAARSADVEGWHEHCIPPWRWIFDVFCATGGRQPPLCWFTAIDKRQSPPRQSSTIDEWQASPR
jgi:hypothetical protein